MPDTQLTTALPTRITFRKTVEWIRHFVTSNGRITVPERLLDAVTDRLAYPVLILVAVGVFIGGAMSVAIGLSVVITSLPAHPVALFVATPIVIVALYTLPLVVIWTVTPVLRATERLFKLEG